MMYDGTGASTHLRIYRQGIACRALRTGIDFQPHRLKSLEWNEEELRLYECSVIDGMIYPVFESCCKYLFQNVRLTTRLENGRNR